MAITEIVATIVLFLNVAIPPIKTLDTVIKNGNLPLHGTNAFVRIAINLSLLDSIILQPVTPTLLQPNPIQIVKACFPSTSCFFK